MAIVSRAFNEPSRFKSPRKPYRVMLVDDSAVIRGMLNRWLSADQECEIVGAFYNGAQAVANVRSCNPEIVILDIEMPEMDGLTALPQLIRLAPGLKVLMASTLTRRNAEISIRALSMGAADYISKPESARSGTATADFQRELLNKVKAIGAAVRRSKGEAPVASRFSRSPENSEKIQAVPKDVKEIVLRKPSQVKPEILAIGCSTGGPQALFTLLNGLNKPVAVPVIVTQHMPPTFTAILAEHIQNSTGLPTREAVNGDIPRPGEVLIAPGDFHMRLSREGTQKVIQLDQSPKINFCRPAVDPMFDAVAQCYGAAALGVILTGMGYDGREGARRIVEAGGSIVAQDEKSSVVWGMPGAVADAGLCCAVVPLTEMSFLLRRYLQGGVP